MDHIVGGQFVAVVKTDALAQMHDVGERVGLLPVGGQPAGDAQLVVERQQVVEDELMHALRGFIAANARIETVGRAEDGDSDDVGLEGTLIAGGENQAQHCEQCPWNPWNPWNAWNFHESSSFFSSSSNRSASSGVVRLMSISRMRSFSFSSAGDAAWKRPSCCCAADTAPLTVGLPPRVKASCSGDTKMSFARAMTDAGSPARRATWMP